MGASSRTHYHVLGIDRHAGTDDVRRAYHRLRSEMQEEAWAPDARRVVQLQTAYEVLSDDARREAYDRALHSGRRSDPRRRRAWIVGASAAAVVIALALGLGLRKAAKPARSAQETLSAAALAVGRLTSVDIGGHATALGLAFAIDAGRLAAACAAIAPGAQLVVRIGTREIPARLETSPAGEPYCTLSAPHTGSWPLPFAPALPAAGDPVYEVRLESSGEPALAEGRVTRIERGAPFAVLEVSGAASFAQTGAPLLDAEGRVVAIGDARGRHVGLSAPRAANKGS